MIEWRVPDRILVVQFGTNEEEAKVFRAHVVPQGLCENLIGALKLLANQQRDGDSPIQNIVTGLREKRRERVTKGLRSFKDLDNRCAVEVGHLRKGQRLVRVREPKIGADHSEILRKGADDLTLRAEEVKTLKACINIDHVEENRWGRPLVDADWHVSAKQFTKELEGASGKSCIVITEM